MFAVMTAGLFPLIHAGRRWFAYWLLPYPKQRYLWPNFKSPLVWDVFAISTYLTISVVFFIVGLVPDVAALRDNATGSKRKIYAVLSLGWEGSDQQWRHYRRGYGLLAALATPLVLSVHSVVSFDFARGARTVGFLRRQQPFMLLRALGRMVSNDLAVDLGTISERLTRWCMSAVKALSSMSRPSSQSPARIARCWRWATRRKPCWGVPRTRSRSAARYGTA